MKREFEEAIARVMFNSDDVMPEVCLLDAADILAMPEMQAIRKVLQRVAEFGIAVCDTDALMSDFYDLPDAIHDWVDVGAA
jgi:hypothetical protein